MLSDRNGDTAHDGRQSGEDRRNAALRLAEVERQLTQLGRLAQEDGHEMLVYLLEMARTEARHVAETLRKKAN